MWAAAETVTIIMGASIPFLRKLLWQIFKHPKNGTDIGRSGRDPRRNTAMSGTIGRLGGPAGGRANHYEVNASKSSDDASDKSIFGEKHGNNTGIMVSQQFAVHVDSGSPRTANAAARRW